MFTHLKAAAQKMLIDFESTRDVPHNATKGAAREAIVVKEFLRPYLPTRYSISSGLIMDVEGNTSKQQDLVIYDQFHTPILRDLGSDRIFFPESVYAALEVKSVLTYNELRDIVEKSVSIWKLRKTGFPSAILTPNLSIPHTNIPALFLGMCFSARVTLVEALLRLRMLRTEMPEAFVLGGLCILQDKDGHAGLIVNVRQDNILQVDIAPSSNSRLAIIRCETSGHALMYSYLLLMEHLRNYGTFMSGPDLMAYATAGGLGIPELSVSGQEMEGASAIIDGRLMSVDSALRVQDLYRKIVEGQVADEEILEWFFLLPTIPYNEMLLDERVVFAENEIRLPMAGTRAVHDAIRRQRQGEASAEDLQLLGQFVTLIRAVTQEPRILQMGNY